MSILQEILNWSNNLPAWQSDAIGRLFEKEELSIDDLDDLYALLKDEHGLEDPKERKASRLSADLSVITIIDVVMFTLFDGGSGDAEWECSDRAPCRSWC